MARMLAGLGIAFQFGPLLGFACMFVSITRCHDKLDARGEWQATFDGVATDFQFAWTLVAVGYLLMFTGLVPLAVALWGMRYRARWFFWALLWVAAAWTLLLFPFGVVLAGPVTVYVFSRKREFFRPPEGIEQPNSTRRTPVQVRRRTLRGAWPRNRKVR